MSDLPTSENLKDQVQLLDRRINLDNINTNTNLNAVWPPEQPWTIPTIPTITTGIQLTTPDIFSTMIRKVENGFVLKLNNKEYVFETVDNLLVKLKEELTK